MYFGDSRVGHSTGRLEGGSQPKRGWNRLGNHDLVKAVIVGGGVVDVLVEATAVTIASYAIAGLGRRGWSGTRDYLATMTRTEALMSEKFDPIKILFTSFGISSLGGLAALLRSRNELNVRAIVSAMLYSGLTGLIIALLWYSYYDGKGNIYFLLGVSGLAGIGGTTVVDFIIQVAKAGGVYIAINPGDKPADEEKKDDD